MDKKSQNLNIMTTEQIISFCFEKETKPITRIDRDALQKCELRPQESHIKIKNGKFSIVREHENQDQLRSKFLLSLFSCRDGFQSQGVKLSDLDCEFIFNSGDDVDFYEEGVPRWCFTRRAHHPNLLIPNSHVVNVQNVTKSFCSTDIDFEKKEDKAIFAGSYAGGSDPKENQRFRFCWENQNSQLGDLKITNFFMDGSPNGHSQYLEKYEWKKIESEFIPYSKQLKYKYIFNINGNTNSWDRLPWAMNSNSLCLFLRPKREDMCWHYHYFKTFGGFVYVDETDWEASVEFFNANPSVAKKLVLFQQKQSATFVSLENHINYFAQILAFYNKLYNS
jgi:hypothetical protein